MRPFVRPLALAQELTDVGQRIAPEPAWIEHEAGNDAPSSEQLNGSDQEDVDEQDGERGGNHSAGRSLADRLGAGLGPQALPTSNQANQRAKHQRLASSKQ